MPTRNFIEIHKKYKGKWVVLTPDEKSVVASGKTLKKILDDAKKKGFEHPIVMRVQPSVVPYIGTPFFVDEV